MKSHIASLSFALFLLSRLVVSAIEPPRDIPTAHWEEIYFRSIDRLTTEAKLTPLRTSSAAQDHLEARFWFGFGLFGEHGVIIRRDGTAWSAIRLDEDRRTKTLTCTPIFPRSSWEDAWRLLEGARLLSLPDFSTLPQSDYSVYDGSSGVVEVMSEGRYRTYMYPNSWCFDNEECRLFEKLVSILQREFLGEDVEPRERTFLSGAEIAFLGDTVASCRYPLRQSAFLDALPFRLLDRGLESSGSSGTRGVWTKEWPLTCRVDPKGYYVLVGYLDRSPLGNPEPDEMIRGAEVQFRDRQFGLSLVLRPSLFATEKAAEPGATDNPDDAQRLREDH